MGKKTQIGGIMHSDGLAMIGVLAMPSRPGLAGRILSTMGEACVNVQFIVQLVDRDSRDHVVVSLTPVGAAQVNIEEEVLSIESMGGFKGGIRGRFFVSEPSNENSYEISYTSVSHYGRYSIRVYRVNQEYADLYTSRQQDSRDLNEPLTNIINGLGIFSAFNSREMFINVIRD